MRTKWPEPPLDGPPYVQETIGVIANPAKPVADGHGLIDSRSSCNGTWTEFTQCPSDAAHEKVLASRVHCAWYGRVKTN